MAFQLVVRAQIHNSACSESETDMKRIQNSLCLVVESKNNLPFG